MIAEEPPATCYQNEEMSPEAANFSRFDKEAQSESDNIKKIIFKKT